MADKTRPGTPRFDDQSQMWKTRIESANKHYESWESRFDVKRNEDYYEGEQWPKEATGGKNYKPYVVNLVFSTIEVKSPGLLFTRPTFSCAPRPWKNDFDEASAQEKATLKQDTLNSFVMDKNLHFAEEAELTILDAWFRFGIMEVGYSADWTENPNAGKPILKSDNTPYVDEDTGQVIREPKRLPEDERIYVRNIPACTFRVGGLDTYKLDGCNWVGYYEYIRVGDLKANKSLINTSHLDAVDRSADFTPDPNLGNTEFDNLLKQGDLMKVWKIWDNRSMTFWMWVETNNLIIKKSSFERLPLFPLVFHKRTKRKGFLPIPPVTAWLSAQDEMNESREMLRVHRRRFVRKYLTRKGAFDEGEFDKLMAGADGSFSDVEGDPNLAVAPLPLAELSDSETKSLIISKDDFNIVSGTSSEERGESDRTTATQANIKNQRAQLRESKPQSIVAEWLCNIGREILLLARDKLVNPIWIKRFFDSQSTIGMEMPQLMYNWKQIVADEDLDGNDFDVEISLESLSPITNDDAKKKFIEMISVLTQFPQISMSPTILNEFFDKYGYRNMKVRAEMLKMATLAMVGQLAMAQQAVGAASEQPAGGPGNMAQNISANAIPPTMEVLQNNLATE